MYAFRAPSEGSRFPLRYAHVTVEHPAKSGVRLNGRRFDERDVKWWRVSSTYWAGRLRLRDDDNRLSHETGAYFTAVAYGYGVQEAYGFNLGFVRKYYKTSARRTTILVPSTNSTTMQTTTTTTTTNSPTTTSIYNTQLNTIKHTTPIKPTTTIRSTTTTKPTTTTIIIKPTTTIKSTTTTKPTTTTILKPTTTIKHATTIKKPNTTTKKQITIESTPKTPTTTTIPKPTRITNTTITYTSTTKPITTTSNTTTESPIPNINTTIIKRAFTKLPNSNLPLTSISNTTKKQVLLITTQISNITSSDTSHTNIRNIIEDTTVTETASLSNTRPNIINNTNTSLSIEKRTNTPNTSAITTISFPGSATYHPTTIATPAQAIVTSIYGTQYPVTTTTFATTRVMASSEKPLTKIPAITHFIETRAIASRTSNRNGQSDKIANANSTTPILNDSLTTSSRNNTISTTVIIGTINTTTDNIKSEMELKKYHTTYSSVEYKSTDSIIENNDTIINIDAKNHTTEVSSIEYYNTVIDKVSHTLRNITIRYNKNNTSTAYSNDTNYEYTSIIKNITTLISNTNNDSSIGYESITKFDNNVTNLTIESISAKTTDNYLKNIKTVTITPKYSATITELSTPKMYDIISNNTVINSDYVYNNSIKHLVDNSTLPITTSVNSIFNLNSTISPTIVYQNITRIVTKYENVSISDNNSKEMSTSDVTIEWNSKYGNHLKEKVLSTQDLNITQYIRYTTVSHELEKITTPNNSILLLDINDTNIPYVSSDYDLRITTDVSARDFGSNDTITHYNITPTDNLEILKNITTMSPSADSGNTIIATAVRDKDASTSHSTSSNGSIATSLSSKIIGDDPENKTTTIGDYQPSEYVTTPRSKDIFDDNTTINSTYRESSMISIAFDESLSTTPRSPVTLDPPTTTDRYTDILPAKNSTQINIKSESTTYSTGTVPYRTQVSSSKHISTIINDVTLSKSNNITHQRNITIPKIKNSNLTNLRASQSKNNDNSRTFLALFIPLGLILGLPCTLFAVYVVRQRVLSSRSRYTASIRPVSGESSVLSAYSRSSCASNTYVDPMLLDARGLLSPRRFPSDSVYESDTGRCRSLYSSSRRTSRVMPRADINIATPQRRCRSRQLPDISIFSNAKTPQTHRKYIV